jgi:NAD(P)-dependent dehydrogenase (short-subunit alcohol dehydrogenase family)
MASKTTVLITGANRGIGLGLLERYLAKPSHIVIAAVRNPGHPTVQALDKLPKGPDSQLIVVKIDASIEKDAHDAVAELQQKHGISHLDIVIANAGVAYIYPTVADVKISDIKAHMEPNVYGTIILYQATRGLLKKSSREPIFMIMGSSAGLLK